MPSEFKPVEPENRNCMITAHMWCAAAHPGGDHAVVVALRVLPWRGLAGPVEELLEALETEDEVEGESIGRPRGDTEVLGHHIPAGRRVTIGVHLTHHLPALWPDPEKPGVGSAVG